MPHIVRVKGESANGAIVAAVSPAEKPRAAETDALAALTSLVAADLVRVNEVILDRMQSPVALIPLLAGHLIRSGGKRLRPMLTLASAGAFGYRGDKHLLLSAAVEFIHTATLLHDDVVDESDLRRGLITAHVVWGNQASVLVGDFLFSRAFRLMVETGNLRVLDILSNAAAVIAEGEVMQLSAANDTNTTRDTYLKVIESKTAELFAAAAEVGAVIAGAPAGEVRALRDYGLHLGMAFQLIDDALDYAGAAGEMGKAVGDDFKEGKITLPVVLAFERGTGEERKFWSRTLEAGEQTDADLPAAMRLLERYDAIASTIDRAKRFGETARAALAGLPINPYTVALDGIVDFCIARAY
jgi:octaprenyl-diphosphate synthase